MPRGAPPVFRQYETIGVPTCRPGHMMCPVSKGESTGIQNLATNHVSDARQACGVSMSFQPEASAPSDPRLGSGNGDMADALHRQERERLSVTDGTRKSTSRKCESLSSCGSPGPQHELNGATPAMKCRSFQGMKGGRDPVTRRRLRLKRGSLQRAMSGSPTGSAGALSQYRNGVPQIEAVNDGSSLVLDLDVLSQVDPAA